MYEKPKPYKISEICYNPNCPDTPWYVTRSGTIAEQGGFTIGTEAISFESIESACAYLSEMIRKDMEIILSQIESKEKNGNR